MVNHGAMAASYTFTPFTSFSYRNFSLTFSFLSSEKDKILSLTDMTENNAERFSSAVLSCCLVKLQTASRQRSSLFLLVQLSGDNMWFTMMSLFPFPALQSLPLTRNELWRRTSSIGLSKWFMMTFIMFWIGFISIKRSIERVTGYMCRQSILHDAFRFCYYSFRLWTLLYC